MNNSMSDFRLNVFCSVAKTLSYTKATQELHITQPTLSHHMKILCDTGLVDSCKCGKWMYYSLSLEGGRTLRALVERYTISEEAYADYKTCESCRDNGAGNPCQDDGKEAVK